MVIFRPLKCFSFFQLKPTFKPSLLDEINIDIVPRSTTEIKVVKKNAVIFLKCFEPLCFTTFQFLKFIFVQKEV